MKKIIEVGENRLSRILAGDKNQNPERYCTLISSDLKLLLSNYAELTGDVEVEIYEDDGEFKIEMYADAIRMKNLGMLP